VADPAHTDRIIAQGQALARAIEALGTIEPTGPFERALHGCCRTSTSGGMEKDE
jgi:hypothetical protein